MPYNFGAESIHTKQLCSSLSSSEVQFYTKSGRFAFLRLLWATYDVGKLVVDFLLTLIELFWLGVTAEALRANID